MKILTFKDHTKYLVRLKYIEFVLIFIDLGALVMLIITNIKDRFWNSIIHLNLSQLSLQSIFTFIASLFLVVKIIISFISSKERIKKFYSVPKNKNLKLIDSDQFERVKFSNYEKMYDADKITYGNHIAIYYKKLSHYIINNSIEMEMDQTKKHEIKQFIKDNQELFEKFLSYHCRKAIRKEKELFNEEKLCLSTDLESSPKVICHHLGYFDSLITNESCGKIVITTDDERTYCSAKDLIPIDIHDQMMRISKTKLNNHIGVSTIVITKDNFLVLLKQNSSNLIEAHKITSSGSGSANETDADGHNFNQSIITTMEREMIEELCNNQQDFKQYIKGTKILGYFRWVNRGGKPEFSGLTKLDCLYIDLPRTSNKEVTKQINMTELIYKLNEIDDIPKIIKKIKKQDLAFSLYMNLFLLEDYYNHYKEQLKEFINLNLD